jgi:tyrosyl-tRNA synthetase
MTEYQSDLLRLLSSRGYIHQVTDPQGLDALAARQVVPGYIGFDPTAPSLHVGRSCCSAGSSRRATSPSS